MWLACLRGGTAPLTLTASSDPARSATTKAPPLPWCHGLCPACLTAAERKLPADAKAPARGPPHRMRPAPCRVPRFRCPGSLARPRRLRRRPFPTCPVAVRRHPLARRAAAPAHDVPDGRRLDRSRIGLNAANLLEGCAYGCAAHPPRSSRPQIVGDPALHELPCLAQGTARRLHVKAQLRRCTTLRRPSAPKLRVIRSPCPPSPPDQPPPPASRWSA